VEVGVLGPVELVHDGARVPLGGPKQRLVFGMLAAWRGRVVPVDELIDGLWPEGPQGRPRKTVQVYVTRLRRALGPGADGIRSEATGYRLDPALLPVDADQFELGVRAARADTDDDRAVATLRTALGRWRGDAFVDLRECAALVPNAVRLDERRLSAMYELFDREIRRRPREVVGELEQAVEGNPLHEGFAAQLMTAQYRAGRQADALRTYQLLRRRLGDELGIEPGPEIRELEGRILRHELSVVRAAPPDVPERQRRRVTVVSMELAVLPDGGLPVDPEDELALAAPLRRAARSRIVERGGVILADAGDGLSACFGYPSTERSIERAVLAALAVRDLAAATTEGVASRIGVDTGIVVVEGRSDDGTAELTGIAGEPLRAATRLRAAAAPGQLLVGATTADGVRGVVELEPLEPGVAGSPFVVGRRLGTDRQTASSPGLVGRESALAELEALAERSATRLCPVVVAGPTGVGKSALVERFVAGLGPSSSVIELFCDPRRSATPLHPFHPVLPDVFEGGVEPSVRHVVSALRERWAGREPVLVVDDVDAADPTTRELLDELPDQLASGLVVLTSRAIGPFELGGDLVAQIVLGPLDRAVARRVVASVAGERRLPLGTVNEIVDRAGGLPLHIEALTKAVLDDAGQAGRVPHSLYDSLMSSLDRLGAARGLAQRLSVLGPSFDAADLAFVAGDGDGDGDGHEVPAQLATMVEAGILRVDDGRYRFANALVADAAYESLLNADRRALHATIAESMAAAPGRTAPEALAFHLGAAGRPFDAAVAYRRASADAIRRARHREAQDHARRALALLDRLGPDGQPDGGDTRRRALTNLAVGLQATRHGTQELHDVVAEARASGVGRDDLPKRVLLDTLEISNLHFLGEFGEATEVAEASVRAAEEDGNELWQAFARQFLGATLVWRGELDRGVPELERAAAFWECEGVPGMEGARAVGAMWSLLGLAATFADRPHDADVLLARARAAIPAGDGYGRCLVAATAAMADQLADRPDVVRAAVEPVWSLAMDLASDFWLGWAQALLGWAIAADDGDAGLAMMVETVDDASTRQTKPYFAYLLGTRLCEHGRPDEGLARLEEGLTVAEESGERLWVPLLQLTTARWLDATGDTVGAGRVGAEAADAAAAMGQHLVLRWHAEWSAGRVR
jgi:DNA-binding SARP family transcriptional activator